MRSLRTLKTHLQEITITPGAAIGVVAALYLLALILLSIDIGGHPVFLYNWEEYTARDTLQFWNRPGWGIFEVRHGLMTNSGDSPLIAIPVWAGFKIAGIELTSMRIPIALLAAAAVPMLWLFARQVAGNMVAIIAASLLLLSPVFLLYGRTATLVGLSVPLALATMYVLLRLIKNPLGWRWLIGLQLCLLAGAYAYAPIRFLWLISLMLLAYEFIIRASERRDFIRAIVITAIVLPIALSLGYWSDPGTAVGKYYYGRGEQVISLSTRTERYRFYIDEIERNDIETTQQTSSAVLALKLVGQNTVDLGNLLTDFDTEPVLTSHWLPEGRFYPWFLAPFFLIGLVRSILRSRSSVDDRLLVVVFAGFTLPLLLTSKVHAGRMIFALPILCIFVAAGFIWLIGQLQARFGSRINVPAVAAVLSVLLLGSMAFTTWLDYRSPPPPTSEAQVAIALKSSIDDIRQRGGAGVLVLDTFDIYTELDIAEYQLTFIDVIRFQDGRSNNPGESAPDSQVTVIYGLEINQLATAAMCRNVYFVDEDVLDDFLAIQQDFNEVCDELPVYWTLRGLEPAVGPQSGFSQ